MRCGRRFYWPAPIVLRTSLQRDDKSKLLQLLATVKAQMNPKARAMEQVQFSLIYSDVSFAPDVLSPQRFLVVSTFSCIHRSTQIEAKWRLRISVHAFAAYLLQLSQVYGVPICSQLLGVHIVFRYLLVSSDIPHRDLRREFKIFVIFTDVS